MCGLFALATPLAATAQSTPAAPATPAPQAHTSRDGSHDFDFEIGTWTTHLRRLVRPLTGSTTWVEETWELNWVAVDTRRKE